MSPSTLPLSSSKTLVLFDIDGTLLLTSGVGIQAMADAGRDLFGPSFSVDGIEFAGQLDPLLAARLFARHGIQPTTHNHANFRTRYRERLQILLQTTSRHRALPGVLPLLTELRLRDDIVVGLLTGNFAETGRIKLTACGINPEWFTIAAWGDDSPHDPPSRDHLPAVAMQRFTAAAGGGGHNNGDGRPIAPHRVVIIGDTPHDIACAKAGGCRSIGVATGKFTTHQLAASGADLALSDLSNHGAVVEWIVSDRATLSPRS